MTRPKYLTLVALMFMKLGQKLLHPRKLIWVPGPDYNILLALYLPGKLPFPVITYIMQRLLIRPGPGVVTPPPSLLPPPTSRCL
jgi:hypothetical protein